MNAGIARYAPTPGSEFLTLGKRCSIAKGHDGFTGSSSPGTVRAICRVWHSPVTSQLLRYASDCARANLESTSTGAWDRSQRAAGHASNAVRHLGRPRGDIIIAAAWLHAVGESPDLARTGFAPVDGALYLLAEGWPAPVVNLVAYQSQARLLASAFDATGQLALFERIQGWPSDILDYSCVMALSEDRLPDPEECLRRAFPPDSTPRPWRTRDAAERERRLRRALDRVQAEMISASSTALQYS